MRKQNASSVEKKYINTYKDKNRSTTEEGNGTKNCNFRFLRNEKTTTDGEEEEKKLRQKTIEREKKRNNKN